MYRHQILSDISGMYGENLNCSGIFFFNFRFIHQPAVSQSPNPAPATRHPQ